MGELQYMTEDLNETIDNWPHIMLEYPFVRRGMTKAEYFEEKEYYKAMTPEDLKEERYKPLWKQREEENGKR